MRACIDLGLKRIGFALEINGVVLPQEPIIRHNRAQAASQVSARLKEFGVKELVIGVPMGSSSEEEMRRRAEHFASLLDFAGKVVFFDESFSSMRAASMVPARRAKHKSGRQDSAAAMLVLKDYLGI